MARFEANKVRSIFWAIFSVIAEQMYLDVCRGCTTPTDLTGFRAHRKRAFRRDALYFVVVGKGYDGACYVDLRKNGVIVGLLPWPNIMKSELHGFNARLLQL